MVGGQEDQQEVERDWGREEGREVESLGAGRRKGEPVRREAGSREGGKEESPAVWESREAWRYNQQKVEIVGGWENQRKIERVWGG